MEIVCINDVFSIEKIEYFRKYNILLPKKDKLYTIRKIINHSCGKKGILLHEIINKKIPSYIISLGNVYIEPTWDIKRFSTLLGNEINLKEIEYVEMEK